MNLNVKNVKVEKLAVTRDVRAGDTFILMNDSKEIHRELITVPKRISHFAYFEISDCGCAYAIGDERLEKEFSSDRS